VTIERQKTNVLPGWHGLAAQVSENAKPFVNPGGQPVAPKRTLTT
jgi:hypothetical protein